MNSVLKFIAAFFFVVLLGLFMVALNYGLEVLFNFITDLICP